MAIKHRIKKTLVSGIALFVLVFFVACAQKTKPDVADKETPQVDLIWPKAPEKPRIEYLFSLATPADIRGDEGAWSKLFSFLKGGEQPRVRKPHGLSKDLSGRLFIVDTSYKVIHVFNEATGEYYWFPKKSIEGFNNPIDIAVGSNGKIFVSNSFPGSVHIFTEGGKNYIGMFGDGELLRPTGLAVRNGKNELFVVDTVASQVIVYDQNVLSPKQLIGEQSELTKGFHYPTHITRSRLGDLYVTDSLNFRIQHLTDDFKFKGFFGQVGDSPGDFSRPKGVATDSEGNVYVVDALFDNVQVFNRNGKLLMSFGSPGSRAGEFWLPTAIFIDKHDRIYVSDTYNNRVQVFQYLKVEAVTP